MDGRTQARSGEEPTPATSSWIPNQYEGHQQAHSHSPHSTTDSPGLARPGFGVGGHVFGGRQEVGMDVLGCRVSAGMSGWSGRLGTVGGVAGQPSAAASGCSMGSLGRPSGPPTPVECNLAGRRAAALLAAPDPTGPCRTTATLAMLRSEAFEGSDDSLMAQPFWNGCAQVAGRDPAGSQNQVYWYGYGFGMGSRATSRHSTVSFEPHSFEEMFPTVQVADM